MKTLEINGSLRKSTGKKDAAILRKSNMVPCILYGGKENIHFSTHENNFLKLVYTSEVHFVKLHIDGMEFNAILKDIQFHPVSDKIIHADFTEIFDDKSIVVSIPVKVTGDAPGVKAGGKLKLNKRYLRIKGLPKDIPDHITIDITNLKIHDSIKTGDIAIENIELLEPDSLMILNIATSRVAQKAEETAPEAEKVPSEQTAEKTNTEEVKK
ncbi:MAG: 50S ribosomal protein L25/general stress protein Ctc [Bacteroidales bacterium]|nr:50S ribosomal protein L25/general stress protein Ctc [Bacteroidales bacterium]